MLLKLLRGWFARRPEARAAEGGATSIGEILKQSRALQYARHFERAGALIEDAIARGGGQLAARSRADLLIEAALCRLRQYRLADASALFARARAACPEHPLIESLAQYPALVGQELPVERRALAPVSVGAAAADTPVSAVYFFLTTPDTAPEERRAYFALMQRSIASLRAAIPRATALLITDRATAVEDGVGFDAILREDLNAAELVHARLTALSRLLGSDRIAGNVVLLDPDTLVLRDFRAALDCDFDLGFTMRSDFAQAAMDHEPINVGVIFVRAAGAQRARAFFELCLRHFADMEARPAVRRFYPAGLRTWRGDQVLPAAVIGWREFAEQVLSGRTNRMQVADCVVAFFESKLYNSSETGGAVDTPCIVHYKGRDKARMLQELQAARP